MFISEVNVSLYSSVRCLIFFQNACAKIKNVNTLRVHGVYTMSHQRKSNVSSTLLRRCLNFVYLLGITLYSYCSVTYCTVT